MDAFSASIDEIIEDFLDLADWNERYNYLIELGRQLPRMRVEDHCDANRVHGCVSVVWLTAGFNAESPPRLKISADSDSLIVKGLIAILLALFAGRTAEEVAAVNVEPIFERLGLKQHLSPNRRNGLYAMVKRINELAAAQVVKASGQAGRPG